MRLEKLFDEPVSLFDWTVDTLRSSFIAAGPRLSHCWSSRWVTSHFPPLSSNPFGFRFVQTDHAEKPGVKFQGYRKRHVLKSEGRVVSQSRRSRLERIQTVCAGSLQWKLKANVCQKKADKGFKNLGLFILRRVSGRSSSKLCSRHQAAHLVRARQQNPDSRALTKL